jgi:hypothetical protein
MVPFAFSVFVWVRVGLLQGLRYVIGLCFGECLLPCIRHMPRLLRSDSIIPVNSRPVNGEGRRVHYASRLHTRGISDGKEITAGYGKAALPGSTYVGGDLVEAADAPSASSVERRRGAWNPSGMKSFWYAMIAPQLHGFKKYLRVSFEPADNV